jgi:DNA-binding NarL/FixJ family response regulator
MKVVDEQPDMEVIGEEACCESGCRGIEGARPDLVVFDINLGDTCGPGAIVKFRSHFPDLTAIVFTANTERQVVVEALKQRIQGFVAKSSPVDRLLHAIRTVAGGQPYLDPEISPALIAGFSEDRERPEGADLSVRQVAVLRLLAEGLSNKEIARDLFITESTVKFHVSAILQVLDARNRSQAVRIAERRGWILRDPPVWESGSTQFAL